MKIMRNLVLFVALGLVFWSGCSGGGGAASKGPTDGVLRVNTGAEPEDLDPHLVTGVPEHRICGAIFEGLADLDPVTMEPVPAAAAAWTVSDDGLVYTFQLRPEGAWSNGDPLTATDFVYSYQRMLSPKLGAEYVYMLFCLKNARAYAEGAITDFAEVGAKVLDPLTLELTLEHPTPYLLHMQMHQAWFPVHRATIEKFGGMDARHTKWTQPENIVSNGAFRLVEWRPTEVLRVVPNEHYWDRASVRLKGINFFPIDNLMTEERQFRAGALDLTESMPLHKIAVYQKENPELVHIDPYLGVYYYRMNTTKPPLNDKRVRLALSMALDRERLAREVLKAGEKPAFNFVPPQTGDYVPDALAVYDVEQARALLAEAGYPGGQGLPVLELMFNTSEAHKTIAEAVQKMWKEALGVQIQLVNQDWKVYLDREAKFDYTLSRAAWIADYVDPMTFLDLFVSGGGNNRTGWANPEYDALIRAAAAEPDAAKRLLHFQQAEALLLAEMPLMPVYFYTFKYLKNPALQGHVSNPVGYRRWKGMYF